MNNANKAIIKSAKETWAITNRPARRKLKRMLETDRDWKSIIPSLRNSSQDEVNEFIACLKALSNGDSLDDLPINIETNQ